MIVIEGVCALHKMFREAYDLRVWVEAPRDLRLARGIERDGEGARVEAYCERYPELAADPKNVLELIAWEYKLRRRRESGLTAGEYRQRFPQATFLQAGD